MKNNGRTNELEHKIVEDEDMGKKELLNAAFKKPYRIPRYLLFRTRLWTSGLQEAFNEKVRKRVPFSYEAVASGWGKEGAGLPRFSSRLYREVKLLQEALAGCSVEKSLEIGCGYGRLTPWIMEYSKEHYAIEPEKKLFEVAKQFNPKAHVFNIKAQELPFSSGFFDLCVTWTVLQHIPPKELEKVVKEIKRVAKRSAIILITEETRLMAEETGTIHVGCCWFRTLEEWEELFKPWRLVRSSRRVVEDSADKGAVMRFENDQVVEMGK